MAEKTHSTKIKMALSLSELKLNVRLIIIGAIITVLNSCEYKYIEPVVIPPQDSVSFSLDIQPIFNQNCVGCHSGASPSGGLDLSAGASYDQLISKNLVETDTANAAASVLYERITDTGNSTGPMPPSGILPAAKTDPVLQWLKEGAKNN